MAYPSELTGQLAAAINFARDGGAPPASLVKLNELYTLIHGSDPPAHISGTPDYQHGPTRLAPRPMMPAQMPPLVSTPRPFVAPYLPPAVYDPPAPIPAPPHPIPTQAAPYLPPPNQATAGDQAAVVKDEADAPALPKFP